MQPRKVIDRTTTPDGQPVELAREHGHYVLRVGSIVLMSSEKYGSEQAMAGVAVEAIRERKSPRILVGGLGLGYTLRATLDQFDRTARITVAELLPELVTYNRGVLGPLAGHPLADPRVTIFVGDVRIPIAAGKWDAILMDVDNGPDAFTTESNKDLYDDGGAERFARALNDGGVLVVWSLHPNRAFERRLRRAGLDCETRRVSARGPHKKGGSHVLFLSRSRGARRVRASGERMHRPARPRRAR